MTRKRITHRIVHTKNKHSRAVISEGTIVIRLGKNLSKTEEQEHIEYLLRRMTKYVLEERQRVTIAPFKNLLRGDDTDVVTLASGKSYVFTLIPGKHTSAKRTPRGWVISIGPTTRRTTLHKLLWKLLSESEFDRVEELVHRINKETYRVKINKVRLAFASTQWGSCSPKGVIMINTALLFAPPSTLRYVIIHELAHRKRADHSPAYWRWVERGMATYEKAKDILSEYRLPTL